jgi:excisionase family DNA binding protein
MTSDGADWIGTLEAANLLAVTQRAVYLLVDEGKLTPAKVGRVLRFRRSDVETLRGRGGGGSAGVREPRRPTPSPESGAAERT